MLSLFCVRGALFCLLVAELSSCIPLIPSTAPRRSTRDNTNEWHKYVRAPSSGTVQPRDIVAGSVTGGVTNPRGLIHGDSPTVLSRSHEDEPIPSLVVDFGQNLAGYLNVKLKGSPNKDKNSTALPGLRLAFSETLQYLTDRSDFTRSDQAPDGDTVNKVVFNGTDQIAVKSSEYTWTDKLNCQYGRKVCSDGLHGFRYVKISLEALPEDAPYTTSYGTVSISSATLTFSGLRGTPDTFTGWFECSDPSLTQWWYDGVYTNDLATDVFRAEDTEPRQAFSPTLLGKLVLHDGAKRDRDPYVGDLSVSALTSYLSHDTPEAARNVLADLADHQRADGWIPPASIRDYTLPLFDYPLHWILCLHAHLFHTADTPFLSQYYPHLLRTLDTYYPSTTSPTTSLLVRPDGYGDYAFLPRSGAGTYYNALYVLALRRAASLADSLSRPSDASRWRARAETVSAALLRENWDSSAGAFYDGTPAGDGVGLMDTHPQDGNVLAILAGITPPGSEKGESILSYLSRATAQQYGNAFFDNDALLGYTPSPLDAFSTRVYAFISFFDLSARLSSPMSGTVAGGFDLLRRIYGTFARGDPGITMWEGISGGGKGEPYEGAFTSMCHGWSTGVTPLLTGFVLGARSKGVGWERWEVRVLRERGGVTWAKGEVPTPKGGLYVRWSEIGGGRGISVLVQWPEGTSGEVYLPIDRDGVRVLVDGREGDLDEYEKRYEDGYVVLTVGDTQGGSHEFTVGE